MGLELLIVNGMQDKMPHSLYRSSVNVKVRALGYFT